MKIVYCIASIYNPGGMERVLLNKVRWLTDNTPAEIVIVTTDQFGRPPFYSFPSAVRIVDLEIGYHFDNRLNPVLKVFNFLRKRRRHQKALSELLLMEKADIVVSMYPSESSFIPSIKDGSKKVLELHYNKFFRLQYARKGLLGLADRFRTWQDERIVRKFDKFVVLTKEDASYWGELPNLEVIPNAALPHPDILEDHTHCRVIAVGRLDYQKGFDRLLQAWAKLPGGLRDIWHLDIFGQGEWESLLGEMIKSLGIQDSVTLHAPTPEVFMEYASSSFLVMASRYEGLPMVLIEAMSCGVPGICFDFKCGPKDIIESGYNGLIVQEGNIDALTKAMETLMRNNELLRRMSSKARNITESYSEEVVMNQWMTCFESLCQ